MFLSGKTMTVYVKYLVCYDIPDNKRRTKFFNSLKDLGLVSLQYSVFYGDLKNAEVNALKKIAKNLLDKNEDKCFWYPCHLNIDTLKQCIGYDNFQYIEPDGYGII